jgi:antitoxin component of MazEF toxin-antitoxin module
MTDVRRVIAVGGSLYLSIPAHIANEMNINLNDDIKLRIVKGKLVCTKVGQNKSDAPLESLLEEEYSEPLSNMVKEEFSLKCDNEDEE